MENRYNEEKLHEKGSMRIFSLRVDHIDQNSNKAVVIVY